MAGSVSAVITSNTKEKTEFTYAIDSQLQQNHFRQLHEGLLKAQKDLNEKLTEYVNQEKAVNGSSSNTAAKSDESESEGNSRFYRKIIYG